MNDTNIVTVNILDRSYKVKCPADEAQQLQESARHLDEQMRKLRQGGGPISVDRIAVVTALNMCNELLTLKKQKTHYTDTMQERLKSLQGRIENFMRSEDEIPA